MGNQVFMQGNQAMAESAIRAGCKLFFGYPITPSSEVPEYYARAMRERPEEGITFIQAETEVAAFNMVAGAAATGHRAMTATSGPGFSLGQEALSYMSAADLPAVIVEIMRAGPADGEILAAQGDYFQAVKGGGHGDYCNLVLAPYSVQELCELMQESFELAEKYRNPVILLSDATLAKMRESVELPGRPELPVPAELPNALRGCGKDKEPHKVVTCGDGAVQWGAFNDRLQAKYQVIREAEERWESYNLEDADIILVAYGSMARVCVSAGQMVEDVKLSVENKRDVSFFGKLGGTTPSPKVVLEQIRKMEVC